MNRAYLMKGTDGTEEVFKGTDLRAQSVGGPVVELASLEPNGRYVTIAYVSLAPGDVLELREVLTAARPLYDPLLHP